MVLGYFALFSCYITDAKDGDKEYFRPQSILNSSQDLMQNPSSDEQKSTFVSHFSGSTPMVASLGQTSAKSSSTKFGQRGDSKVNLQKAAEVQGKENKERRIGKGTGKERRRAKGVDKSGKYMIKESGIGDSWLIGNDTTSGANAYVNGLSGCEVTLIIPHELEDKSGTEKYVEVTGQYAFYGCGDKDYTYGITRSIVLSKYIKIIKYAGLGGMDDVTSFRIEEGSCLESIEKYGLSWMSYENTNEDARRSILVLPLTVTSIAKYGLEWNNLIKTIYYCGSTHLSNYNALENGVSKPDIKVTRLYTYDTIFKDYTPKKDSSSIAEAEEICKSYGYKPKTSPPKEEENILSKYSKFLAASYLIKS